VQLDIVKETEVPCDRQACWGLIGDVPRLSACIPGVSDLRELEPGRRYHATVTDKLGPFRVQLPVEIAVEERDEPHRLSATLSGSDSRAQARVSGRLEAVLEPAAAGTRLALSAHLDVLGKLATLGATPMRRRADDIFREFVTRVAAELTAGQH
jgi:carbon monoxide dehydrogenase subunit G